MDLKFSDEDVAFREQVRDYLQSALTPELVRAGKRTTSIFSDFDASMEWQRILYKKGWVVPDWPEEYGGPGWTLTQRAIFKEECIRAHAPGLQLSGLMLLGPILMKYGTEKQKELLEPILSGEDVWAQGYSEPNAGSDLASLQTKALLDGDEYVVNGSKIWTSYAHRSNKIFCLVRTNNAGAPQKGISFLLMDMDLPGMTCDQIVGLDGEVEQCQIFFEDVRVPVDNLVGEENQGWEIAKYLLEFERGMINQYPSIAKRLKVVRDTAAQKPVAGSDSLVHSPVFSAQLAEVEIDNLSLEQMENRIRASISAGQNPGTLASLVKVAGTELSQRVDQLALEAQGTFIAVDQKQALEPAYTGNYLGCESGLTVMNYYLNNRASTIYGGSAQVQRNIIAKVVLGL